MPIVGAGKSEICRRGWQAENSGKSSGFSLEFKIHMQNFCYGCKE